MIANDRLTQAFGTLPDLIRAHAHERPHHTALIDATAELTYRDTDIAHQPDIAWKSPGQTSKLATVKPFTESQRIAA
jgi:hypothetical protein